MRIQRRFWWWGIGILLVISSVIIGVRILTTDPLHRKVTLTVGVPFAISSDQTLLATASGENIILWRLPEVRIDRELHHPALINPRILAWRADGNVVAISGGQHSESVLLYDLRDDSVRVLQEDTQLFVNALAWSPDGQWLAIGYGEAQIHLVSILDGRTTHVLHVAPLQLDDGNFNRVQTLTFDRTGATLISGTSMGIIQRWRCTDGHLLTSFQQEGDVRGGAISPDGQILATASRDKKIRFWNLADGRLLRTPSGHRERVNTVAWSPDGQWLASGSGDYKEENYDLYEPEDATVRVWQVADGQLLATFRGHRRPVDGVAFIADGTWVISGADGDGLRVWRVK